MKVVNIFVASSLTEFVDERKRLGAYFAEKNNQLIDREIFLNVRFCEELDPAVTRNRKQEEYNAFIKDSNLAVFLLNQKCGSYTGEEFNEAFSSEKGPYVLVFQRKSGRTGTDESVKRIQEQIRQNSAAASFRDYEEFGEVEEGLGKWLQRHLEVCRHMDSGPKKLQGGNIKKIRFFLGGFCLENESDRNEIIRFALGLNEKLLKEGMYVQMDPCSPLESIQKCRENGGLWDSCLKNSDFAFFIFFLKADRESRKELDQALEKFYKSGCPKIFTWFYRYEAGTVVPDVSVRELQEMIDKKLHHYYSVFENVDSIKLSILIQISDLMWRTPEILLEDGWVRFQNSPLVEMKNLPAFSKNRILNHMKEQLARAEQEYREAAEAFSRNLDRRDLLRQLSDLDDEREKLRKDIRNEEAETLKLLYEMNRAVVKGRVEELVKKAFSCLERGEVEAAAEILDKSRVDVLFKERMHDRMEELRRDAETAVQTYSYIIQIQKLLGESVKTAETIISCYEEIMGYLRELPSLDCRPALEYALFLDSQNAQRAEQIFREAEYLYQKPDRRRQEDALAELYLGMGKFYLNQERRREAEPYLKKSYDIFHRLYQRNPACYAERYAQLCQQCSVVRGFDSRLLERGLSALLAQLSEKSSDSFVLNTAEYYSIRGNIYAQVGDRDKEEESYRRGIALLEERELISDVLADLYNNLGESVRKNDGRPEKAVYVQAQYEKSLRIYKKLYEEDPFKYARALGDVCNNISAFYIQYGENYYQAVQYLKKSGEAYGSLYRRNPRTGGKDLAENYIQMAKASFFLGSRKRAFLAAEKGISIFEGLYEFNPERFARGLTWAYTETGMLSVWSGDYRAAVSYLEKGMDLLETAQEKHFAKKDKAELCMKIITAWTMADGKGKEEPVWFGLLHRIFQFTYGTLTDAGAELPQEILKLVYRLARGLTAWYEKQDLSLAKNFYYPVLVELGKKRLEDPALPSKERMQISIELGSTLGLMGKLKEGEELLLRGVKEAWDSRSPE